LRLWADQQKKNRIVLYNLALGEKKEQMKLHQHVRHSPSSSLLASTQHNRMMYPFTDQQVCVPVQVDTLDHVMQEVSLLPETLIKIDVQGYEDRVIRGGRDTFSRASAVILEVCHDKLYENQANFKDLVMMLHDLGFHYAGNLEQNYDRDGHVIFLDAVFVK
jgi:FkbM family methyltransferase